MAYMKITSPHAHNAASTGAVMRQVMLGCMPGLIALSYFFGYGSFLNIVLCCFTAVACEVLVLKVRGRPIGFYLADASALVTGLLLGIALPPYCPWWLVVVGASFAIVVAKHFYGGLGYNPFNPAMVGYVILLISFPLQMTQWSPPFPLLEDGSAMPSFTHTVELKIFGYSLDGYTGATPLDTFKHNNGHTVEQLYRTEPLFVGANWAGMGWEWVNLGFLLGGIYLLYRKIFTWHAPVGMLAAIVLLALIFYDGGSVTSFGSPLFHLFSGATMLGAFFIATDPVTSAVSNTGRLIYGAGIGALVFIIRAWGNYPDSVAFAVLLMNFAAPFIDYYTVPRTYGHRSENRLTNRPE